MTVNGSHQAPGSPSLEVTGVDFEGLQTRMQDWLEALDGVPDPALLHDQEGRILWANRAYSERARETLGQLQGRPYWECFPRGDGPLPESRSLTDGEPFLTREIQVDGGGEAFRLLAYSVRDPASGGRLGFFYFRPMRQGLGEEPNEGFFASLTAAARNPILVTDSRGNVAYWNQAAERVFGYSADEILGRHLPPLLAASSHRDPGEQDLAHLLTDSRGRVIDQTLEVEAQRKDGEVFPVELSVSAIPFSGDWYALSIVRDITERKTQEQRLKRTTAFLRALIQANSALVHAREEGTLYQQVCQALTEHQGYPLAWVGLADDAPGYPVRVTGSAGQRSDYLEDIHVSWGDLPSGQGPTGRAIRTGETQVARDLGTDPSFTPWREPAKRRGFASSIAVPIGEGKPALGALNVYASSPDAFDREEHDLLEGLARDLAFGLEALRTQQERDEAQASLRQALFGTVEVISRTVEMRDPYTAGHQKRVGELSRAIGRRLGLEEDRLKGLYVAGLIHDLGKISVPAEILSHPGKLSDKQFQLIQDHAREGYKIIKDVDFPWPVQEAVLQHHEREDGSGYPDGLTGEGIILEAKILGVADVVEAISSHRPYRPALGIDKALEIIQQKRGSQLDEAIVDACVAVFEEDGFRWNDSEHSL